MKNWMHTRAWEKQVFIDLDHQAHVTAYWNDRFAAAAKQAPKITPVFNPRGCYNGIRGWYERGYVSPTEARYPSFKEDPTGYALSGD